MIWSYSRLTAFEDCKYAWYMHYILHMHKKSNFFSEYGSFMHEILQKYLNGELSQKQLLAYYCRNFGKTVESPAPSSKMWYKYFGAGCDYLRNIEFPKRKILATELEVNFDFAGAKFIGYIDMLSEDDAGNLFITDHKSRDLKPRSGRKKPTKADRDLDDYLRQLYMYSVAVKQLYGKYPDFLEFNCFKAGVWITEPFKEERVKEVEDWATGIISEAMKEEEWSENLDYWRCHQLCDMRDCCEFIERKKNGE